MDLYFMQPILNAITNDQHQTRLERIRAYIRDHYAEEMNMAELAKRAGFSKFHFQRVFRETFGETLRDYIKRIRLEKSAYRLMASENCTMTDVAYACGFSSSQHFTKAFKLRSLIVPAMDSLSSKIIRSKIRQTVYSEILSIT